MKKRANRTYSNSMRIRAPLYPLSLVLFCFGGRVPPQADFQHDTSPTYFCFVPSNRTNRANPHEFARFSLLLFPLYIVLCTLYSFSFFLCTVISGFGQYPAYRISGDGRVAQRYAWVYVLTLNCLNY